MSKARGVPVFAATRAGRLLSAKKLRELSAFVTDHYARRIPIK